MRIPDHIYFVSYDHPKGVGNVEQGLESPIECISDIRHLEKAIMESTGYDWIVISNWKELKQWKGKDNA